MELLNLLRQSITSLKSALSEKDVVRFKNSDKLGATQLSAYISNQNGLRIFIVSAIFFVVSIVSFIGMLISGDFSPFSFFGEIMLFFVSLGGIFFLVCMESLHKKQKMNLFTQLFWIIFVISMSFKMCGELSVGENVSGYICLVFLIAVPLCSKLEITVLTAMLILFNIIGSAMGQFSLWEIVLFIICGIFTIYGAMALCNLTCLKWINTKQLQTDEERLKIASQNDKQTGLLNKISGIKKVKEMLVKGVPYAVILIDLDLFKEYNKIKGTATSDKTLYNICSCIRILSKEKTDIVCRYSGDRLMIGIDAERDVEAVSFAESIRECVQRMAIPFEKNEGFGVVTVSVGVSEISNSDTIFEQLFEQAENSLKTAKQAGRNCVGYKGKAFKTY